MQRARRAALLAAACGALTGGFTGVAQAETLTLHLTPGKAAALRIDSPLDDSNFEDLAGPGGVGASGRIFNSRITLTNTGTVPLTGALLVVNGRDFSNPAALQTSLHLPPAPRDSFAQFFLNSPRILRLWPRSSGEPNDFVPRLFTAWKTHVSHADSDTEAGKDPLALLHFWGYALCGDNTTALTRLLHAFGIPARKVPLNGHAAAEYFYDASWHVVDGDQNAFYLRLDNRTLASAEDLRADPFLTLRTKIFGREERWRVEVAAFNSSLFEHVERKESRPIKHQADLTPLGVETLYPGEKLIYHRDRAPEKPVGKTELAQWPGTREKRLGVVEIVINNTARRRPGGEVTIKTAFPILELVNQTTGERIAAPPGEPVFAMTLQPHAADDHLSVFCQRARVSLPVFGKGENTALLRADQVGGAASVEVEIEPSAELTAPGVTLKDALHEGAPEFAVQAEEGVDRLWWQVAAKEDFSWLAPSFDNVIEPVTKLTFDPLTVTFFEGGRPWFLRVKVRRNGVWSEWTPPLKFIVSRPARPSPISIATRGGQLLLSWPGVGGDAEYLVYGSNRRDFLPEVFAAEEIVSMRDRHVEKSRSNKNWVATLSEPTTAFTPTFRFYRIIARRGAALSVPSEIIVTPDPLSVGLPPPLVLQTRHMHAADHSALNGYRDIYLSTEMELPH